MKKPGKKKKRGRHLIILVLLCATVAGVVVYRSSTGQKTEKMDAYTVERGTVETSKTFSATLEVRNSETFYNSADVSMIKELYVSGGQEVKKGDPILTLSNGKQFKAGIAGTVNQIRFKKGDYVWPNINLAQICDLEHLQVTIQVDEYDVKKVEVGEQCIVTVVPLDLRLETTIAHVNRVSASNGRVAYYPVTAYLDAVDKVLPGMTISVQIPDRRAEDVLVLPVAALSYDESGNPCVKKLEDGEYVPHRIEVGLSDGMTVEITQGVSQGDTVYARSYATEEEVSLLTRAIRAVFGVKQVINPENTGRGSRGTGNGSGGMPGGMPGQMPEGMDRPQGRDAFPSREADAGERTATPQEGRRRQEGERSAQGMSSGSGEARQRESGQTALPAGQGEQQTRQNTRNEKGESES